MKAPKSLKDYPKLVRPTKAQVEVNYNKYLLIPYEMGEIMQVAPHAEQIRSTKYDHTFQYAKPTMTDDQFRLRYVVVYRKDPETGKRDKKYVIDWSNVELLTPKTK